MVPDKDGVFLQGLYLTKLPPFYTLRRYGDCKHPWGAEGYILRCKEYNTFWMLPAILSQFPTHFKPLVSFYTPREHQKIRGVMKWAERKVVGSIWQVESIGILSVIKQKGESQKGYFKKTKHAKFSEKQVFLTPWDAHVCV